MWYETWRINCQYKDTHLIPLSKLVLARLIGSRYSRMEQVKFVEDSL